MINVLEEAGVFRFIMRSTTLLIAFIATAAVALHAQGQAPTQAQPPTQPPPQRQPQPQRRATGGPATLAVLVSDPAGAGIGDVKVTMQGAVTREARTEQGRIVFEDVPAGTYRLRFDRDGFISLEREVVARGGAPIDVKVTLTPAPPPPPPPETKPPAPDPVPPVADGAPVTIDLPSFIEKNYIGRSAGKTLDLACAATGAATLIQLHEPLAEHTHAKADEFLYVIAGEGTVREGKDQQPLHAGVLILVPRGVAHAVTVTGRNPLVMISIKSGDRCTAGG